MKTKASPQTPFVRSRAIASSALAAALCGAVVLLSGCDSEPESHLVTAPPPGTPSTAVVTTTTTPVVTTTQAGVVQPTQVVVTQAPPVLQAEAVPTQPGPDYRWLAGYWTWRDNRYEWMAGHWEVPPRPDSVWIAPHWEPENGAYRFYEGYWN